MIILKIQQQHPRQKAEEDTVSRSQKILETN